MKLIKMKKTKIKVKNNNILKIHILYLIKIKNYMLLHINKLNYNKVNFSIFLLIKSNKNI